MITREFTHDGNHYRIELDAYTYRVYQQQPMSIWEGAFCLAGMGVEPTTYRRCTPDRGVLKTALGVLARDPYQRLRQTHSVAIDCMIHHLADRDLPWLTLLRAKQKLGLL